KEKNRRDSVGSSVAPSTMMLDPLSGSHPHHPDHSERRRSIMMVPPQNKKSVAKAAVLSSAMLNSSRGGPTRESVAVISDILSHSTKTKKTLSAMQSTMLTRSLQISCVASLISVCLHTPATFEFFPPLRYFVLFVDISTFLVFLIEVLLILLNNLDEREESNKSRWLHYDLFMLTVHGLSVLLDIYFIGVTLLPHWHLPYQHWFGVIRSLRPIIIVKLIRLSLKVKLAKNRIDQLLRRSSQQVQNVTLFFLFFMTLYAIMGVQLFGKMEYRCVREGTDPNNVTIADLAIPDTMCSEKGGGGYECPEPLLCKRLNMSSKAQGFYGMFQDFTASVFTVYLAASEEGWVYVLYDCMDTLPSHFAFFYFLTLIFFMAWLVKNVFIAVITETFAEMRVQFSEVWAKKETSVEYTIKQKLEKTSEGWRLVRTDDELHVEGRKQYMQRFLRSIPFQCFVIVFVLLNSIINASFVYRHDGTDAPRRVYYYYMEVGFTVLFNLECLVKIICYGWRGYIRRGIFKFEFILAVGSSLNCIHPFYEKNYFTYFQAFRLLRLIKASPILEDFVWKIFSPGKKLGGLVLFTFTFVIIASAISLQLFNSVPNLHYFRTFPQAFMAMFQIITQEGWTDFVVEVLRASDDRVVPFTAIYFVAYHLFATLILLSLFVAVILDNLEMEEELKRVKQLKAREATTSMRTTLPLRLRVFDQFPTRPQMVALKKVDSEFPLPRVRHSFTRTFAVEAASDSEQTDTDSEHSKLLLNVCRSRKTRKETPTVRQIGTLSMRNSIANLLDLSDRSREILSSSFNVLPRFSRSSHTLTHIASSSHHRKDALPFSKTRGQSGKASGLRSKLLYGQLGGENGDVRPSDSAPKKDNKQGEIDIRALQQKRQLAEITRTRIEEEMRENHPFFDRPLFIVGRVSRLRDLCKRIVHAKYEWQEDSANANTKTQRRYKQLHSLIGLMPYLDWAMVTITIMSCISMLFESPWPTTGENLMSNNFYLQIMDYIFVLAMSFELSVKIISNGLFFTPKAVVRDVGGVMNMFIYFTSVVVLLWMPKKVEINSLAQLFLLFRAMRPLRVYTLVPHIRRVVVEFFRGLKEILLVTILMIIVMFIFASFGVQIVGGKLAACNDPLIQTRENCTGVFWQKIFVTRLEVEGKDDDEQHPTILVPRVWTNPRNFNFDHVGNAMLALFETLSYKGWNVIRDILEKRQGPWAVIFIHIYVFIGCMIGLTLFVGVVIANYTENRGTALLTVDQRRWHDLKARLKMAQPLHVPPKPSESARIRTYFYDVTMSSKFNQLFAILVVINSFTLIVPWNHGEEKGLSQILPIVTAISAIINLCFAIEIVLKVTAFTFSGFWQSRRNRIDLVITCLGLAWNLIHFLPSPPLIDPIALRKFSFSVGYIIVILRFFTIASRNSTLKMLMLTVVMSMFRSFFIITAMFLLVLFYAYTGVILFGMVKYGQAVSKHVNFRTGSEALVVLFRSITGEDWNDIMHDCMRSPPFCYYVEGSNYWETDCGNYYGSIIYFCSFYLIITYIVRNLLVAIIMENFSLFYSSEEDALLSYADIRNFQLVWNVVDREQKKAIPVRRVKFLLRLLKGRLEVDPDKDRVLFKHMCYEMEKLHYGDDVSFHDVLYMLSYRSVDIRKSLQLEDLVQREELEFLIEEEVAKQTIRSWLESCLRRIRNPVTQKTSFIDIHKYPNPHSAGVKSDGIPQFCFGGDEIEEEIESKRNARNRRNSIPDVLNAAISDAARKFISSSSERTPTRPRPPESLQLIPRTRMSNERKGSNAKNLHLNVFEMPEEEKTEEVIHNSTKRIDQSPIANRVTPDHSPLLPKKVNHIENTKDINEWWMDLVSQTDC
ncbi:hypothetical protein PFISCL1PPCAC_14613, partial [Pristionchus fissidentatus]